LRENQGGGGAKGDPTWRGGISAIKWVSRDAGANTTTPSNVLR